MKNWSSNFFFATRQAESMLHVIPHSGLALPSPRRARSAGWAPRSPCLHHYQLSLNSSDHHLNYPLSCPPDGFFANYNFSVDGQGIMTAEAWARGAGWNTKRAAGCRCGCKIPLLDQTHRRGHTNTRYTKTCENTYMALQLHRGAQKSTDVDASTHRHTNPFPTSSCRKAIYWPSKEVSSSKVNLRTCLMCSLSPAHSLLLSLSFSPRLRETHLPCKSKYTGRVGKCIHTTGDLITGAVNWAMRTSSTANDT